MLPLHTQECRWFHRGSPDDATVEWFRRSSPWEKEAGVSAPEWALTWRVDRYLPFPGRPDVGLKVRQPLESRSELTWLEWKGRTEELGIAGLGHSAAGRVERWFKWSLAPDELPPEARTWLASPDVRAVRKNRLLRQARLSADGEAVEIPVSDQLPPATDPSGQPLRYLRIELTRLEIAGQRWWTLGFEAQPADDVVAAVFREQMAIVLGRCPGLARYRADQSCGYPAWLLDEPPHPT